MRRRSSRENHIVNRAKPAPKASRPSQAALDELIEQITVDAYGEGEQLWAFRQAFADEVPVPCDALVIGEPLSVLEFDYDGNERRGLTAKCRRSDGRKHVVAVSDVEFPHGTEGERYAGAYRKWMGLAPFPPKTAPRSRDKARRETTGVTTDAPTGGVGRPIGEKSDRALPVPRERPDRHAAKSEVLGAGRNCASQAAKGVAPR